jgi:hypothetical protein
LGQVSTGFATDDFRAALSAAGFSSVSIDPLPPETTAKGPALFLAVGAK